MIDVEKNLSIYREFKASHSCIVCGKDKPKIVIVTADSGRIVDLKKGLMSWSEAKLTAELANLVVKCIECQWMGNNNSREVKRNEAKAAVRKYKEEHGCISCGLISVENWIMSGDGKAKGNLRSRFGIWSTKRILREIDEHRIVICDKCAFDRMGLQQRGVSKRTIREAQDIERDRVARIVLPEDIIPGQPIFQMDPTEGLPDIDWDDETVNETLEDLLREL